jgi:hypothetical protein
MYVASPNRDQHAKTRRHKPVFWLSYEPAHHFLGIYIDKRERKVIIAPVTKEKEVRVIAENRE